jgi:N-acetylmuramoyl-L-alanine amidase
MTLINNPKKIILHCSDTPDEGDRYGLLDIDRWHKARGWSGVGYHYIIRRSGMVEVGRPETEIGAHTQGQNENSLGICLVGTRIFTGFQYQSMTTLIKAIQVRHQIYTDEIYGHYEFNSAKTCPGLDMTLVRAFLDLATVYKFKPRT